MDAVEVGYWALVATVVGVILQGLQLLLGWYTRGTPMRKPVTGRWTRPNPAAVKLVEDLVRGQEMLSEGRRRVARGAKALGVALVLLTLSAGSQPGGQTMMTVCFLATLVLLPLTIALRAALVFPVRWILGIREQAERLRPSDLRDVSAALMDPEGPLSTEPMVRAVKRGIVQYVS